MLRKFFGVFAFLFILSLAIPVAAQRYGRSGNNGRSYDRGGNYGRSYDRSYNRGRSYDRGRNNGYNNRNYSRNRYYTYSPGYYNSYPGYYDNNYPVVRRAPVRRYYRPAYPRYYGRSRNRISVSFGF
jgi:hypothetical protein